MFKILKICTVLAFVTPALASGRSVPRLTISFDRGGSVFEYIQKYNGYREGGVYIRVTDICLSACTPITGLVQNDHVCVSDQALFGFHSAFTDSGLGDETFSKVGTDLAWHIFPKKIQDLIRLQGWDGVSEHPDLVYFKGTDIYDRCPEN